MASLAALAVVSCAPEIYQFQARNSSPQQLFSAGYKSLSERYIDRVDLRDVTLAGLGNLSEVDDSLKIETRSGRVLLVAKQVTAAEWRAPKPDDAKGWARLIAEALETAKSASPAARAKSNDTLSTTVFRGVMSRLDKYSRYADPEEARNNRASREGFGGLGISIALEDGVTIVKQVHRGTPAARAGLKKGDRITHVDGKPIGKLDQREIVFRLRGPVRKPVRLVIDRDDRAGPLEIVVVRDFIVLPTVTAERQNGIVTLKISSFNQGTAKDVKTQVARAEREMGNRLKGLILDLRGNPGGLLDQAVSVADLFLNDGRVVSTRGRHPRSHQIFDASRGEMMSDVPIAVLVNGRSASAAEIVAVALRDHGRAVVIGSSSYGKGTVQTIITMPNGGELTLTWARMHAPSGFAIQDHGIIPAVCTSGDGDRLARLLDGLRSGREAAREQLTAQLRARLSRRGDPDAARQACPPNNEAPAADTEIARTILLDAGLYGKTLADGRPAVAERRVEAMAPLATPSLATP